MGDDKKVMIDGEWVTVQWEDVSELLNIFHREINLMSDYDAYVFLEKVLKDLDK